jgi:hypothetical protein
MTSPPSAATRRRPLPALVFLLALTLLAALVWWRVLDHDSGHAVASPSCSQSKATEPKHLPQQQAVVVQVLNSTKRQGIATKAQRVLVNDGFQAPAQAANDSKAYPGYSGKIKGVAEIRSGPAGADGAKLLRYYFPGASLVKTKEKDATVLVSLGTKYKKVAPAKQVSAALKADGITLIAVSGASRDEDSSCSTSTTGSTSGGSTPGSTSGGSTPSGTSGGSGPTG